MFSAVHHFNHDQIKAIFAHSAKSKYLIAIFDGVDRYILTILGIAVFYPMAFLISMPFFRPF